jgi:hypothetical protein
MEHRKYDHKDAAKHPLGGTEKDEKYPTQNRDYRPFLHGGKRFAVIRPGSFNNSADLVIAWPEEVAAPGLRVRFFTGRIHITGVGIPVLPDRFEVIDKGNDKRHAYRDDSRYYPKDGCYFCGADHKWDDDFNDEKLNELKKQINDKYNNKNFHHLPPENFFS